MPGDGGVDTGGAMTDSGATDGADDPLAPVVLDEPANELDPKRLLVAVDTISFARETEPVDRRMPAKTSLLFTVNHRYGALTECLQTFSRHEINLSKIESRSKS